MATSYGSITIVDITDVGSFSLYPTCNRPLSVIYSPDDTSFTPNWQTYNLTLTPVMYYAGTNIQTTDNNMKSIVWTKQVGTNNPTSISSTDGETVSNGVLTVTKNQFTASSTTLTYICTATYTEPDTQQDLTAVGQITFSLIKNASTIKYCNITGENVFKYASATAAPSPSIITLTATLSDNITNGNWKYYNPTDTTHADANGYVDFPIDANNSVINGTSIVVTPSNVTYNNNVATIKKVTSDINTYDIATVVKLFDGAVGDSNVSAALTNEYAQIPCNSSGTPTITLNTVSSTFTVYEGGSPADGWTYNTPTASSGITGTWNSSTHTWTLNTWSSASGVSDAQTVTFTATKGSTTLTKTFNLIKIKTGQDGQSPVYYGLNCSSIVSNKDIGGNYTPSSIDCSAVRVEGTTSTEYTGYVKVYVVDSGGTSTLADSGAMTGAAGSIKYTCSIATMEQYITSGTTLEYLIIELYQTGGSGSILDKETIAITKDGQTGAQGTAALNIVLGNSHEGIACTSAGVTKAGGTITIPFTCYQGTTPHNASIANADITGLPSGLSISSLPTSATSSGSIVLTVANNSNLGGGNSGEITLNFHVDSTTIPMKFSWSKTFAGTDADPVITFQCYGKSGDVIYNNENTVTLTSQLLEGSTQKTATSYTWEQWGTTDYTIARGTSKELIINPEWIQGYGAFRCTAVYGGKSYYGYISVRDVTDPLQVEVFSTLGEQIVNGVGDGAVYARVFQNGEEVDIIKSINFVTNTSSIVNPQANDYCYLLNSTNYSCTLMKYNGSSWAAVQTDPYNYTYTWSFRDKDGERTTYNGNVTKTGKALYLGSGVINKKLILEVEVSDS